MGEWWFLPAFLTGVSLLVGFIWVLSSVRPPRRGEVHLLGYRPPKARIQGALGCLVVAAILLANLLAWLVAVADLIY